MGGELVQANSKGVVAEPPAVKERHIVARTMWRPAPTILAAMFSVSLCLARSHIAIAAQSRCVAIRGRKPGCEMIQRRIPALPCPVDQSPVNPCPADRSLVDQVRRTIGRMRARLAGRTPLTVAMDRSTGLISRG